PLFRLEHQPELIRVGHSLALPPQANRALKAATLGCSKRNGNDALSERGLFCERLEAPPPHGPTLAVASAHFACDLCLGVRRKRQRLIDKLPRKPPRVVARWVEVPHRRGGICPECPRPFVAPKQRKERDRLTIAGERLDGVFVVIESWKSLCVRIRRRDAT